MRIGSSSWRSILFFIFLVAAGAIAPLRPARAFMLVSTECGWVQGGNVTVVHEDGSSTYFPKTWECWQVWEYYPDDPWATGGGGGTGQDPVCITLLATKPDGCYNPINSPTAYDFGQGSYPGGTAMPRLIAAATDSNITLRARARIQMALQQNTTDMAKLTTSLEEINATLISRVRYACAIQAEMALPGAFGTQRCSDAYASLQQEAGFPGYFERLMAWLEVNEVPLLGDMAMYAELIDWLSPQNSLKLKSDMVAKAKECSMWWDQVEEHNCAA